MWKRVKSIFPSEHQWAMRQLSAYADGELSGPDSARVEAHLKECQTCTEELSSLRWAVELTAQMVMVKAPRSFLITAATAEPRRRALSAAYVYLRSATVAVAALLLLVLASDFLWLYRLFPGEPVPQTAVRKALPAMVEAPVEREGIRGEALATVVVEKEVVLETEGPAEKVVDTAVAEEVEAHTDQIVEELAQKVVDEAVAEEVVVKEVQMEKEAEKPAEKPALSMAPEPGAEKEAVNVLGATLTSVAGTPERVLLEAKQAAPGVEQVAKAEMAQEEPRLLTVPETDLAPLASRAGGQPETPVKENAVASERVISTSTPAAAMPTPTPPVPDRAAERAVVSEHVIATPTLAVAMPTSAPPAPDRVVKRAAPTPYPTPLPLPAPVAEATQPSRRALPPWHLAVRLAELGLGLLTIVLLGSALVIRRRHR
jgi:hypothetical protein